MSEVLLIAGEASADLHGSALLRELKALEPDLKCFGVGGRELAKAGMEILVPAEELSLVGIADWLERWREVLGSYRKVRDTAIARKPDVAILLDLPDFNLRLARRLHEHGIPIVYYISPQVWAWRKYRVKTIQRVVNRMLVVFPFERDFYQARSVEVEFVGHPLLERLAARQAFRGQAEVEAAPRIALLPGSRGSELRHHAALLNETAALLKARFPQAQLRVPVASTLSSTKVREALTNPAIEISDENAPRVLEWADIALVASGTATLETALIGTPFALFYILSRTSGWVAQKVLKYRNFFGMPNLLHGREVVKEFIQRQATPQNLFSEAQRLVMDEGYRREMARLLLECRDVLGQPGASHRAAREVQTLLRQQREGHC